LNKNASRDSLPNQGSLFFSYLYGLNVNTMFFTVHHRGPASFILAVAGIFLLLIGGCQSYQKSYRDPVDNIRRMEPEDMEPEDMEPEEVPDEPQGVPASPDTIRFEQPDGYILDIFLRGDEHQHVAVTADGFYLVMNEEEFYEYAAKDKDGKLLTTGIIARNKADRPDEVQRFLENLSAQESDP